MVRSSRAQKIAEELRSLPEDERVDIIAEMLPAEHDDADEMEPEARDELQRRLDAIARGDVKTLDFHESFQRLLAHFDEK